MKCAAYELPFEEGETFGGGTAEDLLEFLAEERCCTGRATAGIGWSNRFPAHQYFAALGRAGKLRHHRHDRDGQHRVIGEVDRFSAPTLVHEEAIYLHEGVQYQVEKLDYEEKKAYVREVNVDYFTDANLAVS